MLLAHGNDKTMHLVVNLRQARSLGSAHGRRPVCCRMSCLQFGLWQRCSHQRAFEQGTYLVVGISRGRETVTSEDSPASGVDDKYRMLSGVKQNGIGRLRPDPG